MLPRIALQTLSPAVVGWFPRSVVWSHSAWQPPRRARARPVPPTSSTTTRARDLSSHRMTVRCLDRSSSLCEHRALAAAADLSDDEEPEVDARVEPMLQEMNQGAVPFFLFISNGISMVVVPSLVDTINSQVCWLRGPVPAIGGTANRLASLRLVLQRATC